MAAEVNARSNKNSTIAFTLPISCQVCLGKVKNPVLCPNHHVFCGPCMDVWLQKNKQCPACRTAMTAGKKILGGLSQQEEDTEKMTNPDLRKARFDLLYKEYENEFERMHSEIQLLKTENQILKQQTRKDGLTPSRSDSSNSKSTDTSHLLALTKKLQDATKMYEKVKGELTRLKQENTNLKDENLSLNRENQHLRQELAGRSPHRYGRITVSTLETNLASAEKDVTRLTKALERSDKYIEELESELDDYRGKSGSSRRSDRDDKPLTNGDLVNRKYSSDSKVPPPREYGKGADNQHRRQLFSGDMGAKTSSGSSSSSLGLSSYPGPSSASSYLPTTLNSLTSSSSYSTAHSVPLTFTTSSYTSSVPANTYSTKGLDPISESGHYSYVSNVSGDYSSKNDTFALPEPKKRLFENSDDLDMSMSPIKSNRRF